MLYKVDSEPGREWLTRADVFTLSSSVFCLHIQLCLQKPRFWWPGEKKLCLMKLTEEERDSPWHILAPRI